MTNLSPPSPRRHINTRRIECEGYRRDDGLLDIEARLVDKKARAYREDVRGIRQPNEPVHEMQLRLTVNKAMVVLGIEIQSVSAPFPTCLRPAPDVGKLVGKSLAKGWRRAVEEALGGVKGCTHVRELLRCAATSAFQTFYSWPEVGQPVARPSGSGGQKDRSRFIDSCMGWAADGEIVATFYPQLHRKSP